MRPFQYDIERHQRERPWLFVQTRNTWSISWHPTGALLATTGDRGVTKLWDTRTGELVSKYPHLDSRDCTGMVIGWSDDGGLFFSETYVFDGNTGERKCPYELGLVYTSRWHPHLSSTNNFSPLRPNSRQVLTGSFAENLVLRNVDTREDERVIDCDVHSFVKDFAWHPKGRFIAVAFDKHTVCVIDVDDVRIVGSLSAPALVGWSPDGKTLVSRKGSELVIWDALETEERPMPEGMKDELWFKRLSRNISADGSRYIRHGEVYSLESDELLFTLPKLVTSADWSPSDGSLLATCYQSETHIWRLGA